MVERHLAKVDVASSNLVSRSKFFINLVDRSKATARYSFVKGIIRVDAGGRVILSP